MRISEIFYSLQGEGRLAGTPGVFIRLAGCPLRCRWCDTGYAWDASAGTDYSIERITKTIGKWNCSHIVITGGEPMINLQLPELLESIKTVDRHITIETAGFAYMPNLFCHLMSIGPKLSNSAPKNVKLAVQHEKIRFNLPSLQQLINNYQYQLKFVVDSPGDLDEILDCLKKLTNVDRGKVLLMPQAAGRQEYIKKAQMVARLCKRTGLAFSPRLQVLLWNNRKGT